MLQYIRENTRSVGASIIIGLMVLSMALFGVDALFAPENTSGVAGRVNGKEISSFELNSEIQRQRQAWQSRMGGQQSQFLSDDVLQPAAMQQLVGRELVRQAADKAGIKPSNMSVDQLIVATTAFHIDGKFDPDRYRITLSSAGLTPQMYRTLVANDMAAQQYAQGMAVTSFVDQKQIDALAALLNQTRTFDYTTVQWSAQIPSVEPTDEQVKAYYDNNGARFMTEESVDLEYIVIDRSQIGLDFEVTEQELQDRYNDYVSSFVGAVERRVSHILIESNDTATIAAVSDALASGEAFADVAGRLSDDFGSAEQGGDLGFTDGTMFAEQFEAAAANLGVGQVSEPVKTDFGTHFITVTDINAPQAPPFSEVEERLITEARQAYSEGEYVDLISQVEDAVYQASDLSIAAEQVGLADNKVSKMPRSGGSYPLDQQAVIAEAFNEDLIAEGTASPIVELEDGSAVVLRVANYYPSVLKPFDEVSTEANDLVVAQLAKEAALTSATAMAEQQQSLANTASDVRRFDQAQPRPLLQAVFELAPIAGEYSAVQLPSGDAIVVKMVSVGQADVAADELSALKAMFSGPEASTEMTAAQAWMRATAEVETF